MVEISVIMPVYNSEKYLHEAIDSVLAQSYTYFELILVDDGSTDSSGRICDDYSNKDNRVIVIHQKNGGISDARNSGLLIAKGEYIVFADNDDIFKEDLLKENIGIIKKHNADIVKFGVEYIEIDSNSERSILIRNLSKQVLNRQDIIKQYLSLKKNNIFVYVWDSMIRKDLIMKNQISFSMKFKLGGEDIDFNYKIFEHVNTIVINPNKFYIHFKRFSHSTACKFSIEKLEPFILNARREKHYINVMNIKKEEELLIYCMTSYVIQISYTLAHIDQLSNELKVQYLKECDLFGIFEFKYKFLSLLEALFIQPKRALIYWLYAHKSYKTLIKLCA